jgi:alpha-N-arabinofuranosidase
MPAISDETSQRETIRGTIWVLAERHGHATISPFQNGQFVEFLADVVPSMHSEKIFDGSFLGLEPYLGWFIKQTDFRQNPWYPSGAVHRGDYALDSEAPFNGRVSQRITTIGRRPCVLGISQDGIFVEKGKRYVVSAYLRQRQLNGPVNIHITQGDRALAESRFGDVGEEWAKYQATMEASETSSSATLSIEFAAPAALWLDKVSLMPVETIAGWRPDVVQAVRDMRPGIIRFGGTAVREYYEWEEGIGDPDRRVPFPSLAAGGLEPNNVGLDELLALFQAVDAEPLICVRFSGKTPEDAARQVEYCNGGTDTQYGMLRAANGHPEPYRVKYWQIGNEVRSAEYDARLPDFCRAMKAVDPSIKLLSSVPTPGLLKSASQYLDYISPHLYYAADLEAIDEAIGRYRAMIKEHAPGRNIKLAITEWNGRNPAWGTGRAWLWTLDNALQCARFHNYMHRNSDIIEIAIRSNLTGSFCGGALQADNARLYKTPVYYTQSLYGNHQQAHPLTIKRELNGEGAVELLDISATLSTDGKDLSIFAVNDNESSAALQWDISQLGDSIAEARVWTLGATEQSGSRDVTNSFLHPTRVAVSETKIDVPASTFTYTLAPLTLTVLRLHLR